MRCQGYAKKKKRKKKKKKKKKKKEIKKKNINGYAMVVTYVQTMQVYIKKYSSMDILTQH
jgi:hypothetical protein